MATTAGEVGVRNVRGKRLEVSTQLGDVQIVFPRTESL